MKKYYFVDIDSVQGINFSPKYLARFVCPDINKQPVLIPFPNNVLDVFCNTTGGPLVVGSLSDNKSMLSVPDEGVDVLMKKYSDICESVFAEQGSSSHTFVGTYMANIVRGLYEEMDDLGLEAKAMVSLLLANHLAALNIDNIDDYLKDKMFLFILNEDFSQLEKIFVDRTYARCL